MSVCRCDEHEGLAPGNYIVRETKAPDGYEKSSDYYEFSVNPGKVTESGRKNGSGTSLIRFSNKEIRPRRTGGLSVTKTSASSGSLLSGAVIAVYNSAGEKAAGIGTIVSAGYGFICGAYMPISSFGKGLQNFIMLLPGTYGTSLLRNHSLNGVYGEMAKQSMRA